MQNKAVLKSSFRLNYLMVDIINIEMRHIMHRWV